MKYVKQEGNSFYRQETHNKASVQVHHHSGGI